MDSYFDIDPVEGTISTNELLDRETIAQHNISIVATKLSEYDTGIDCDSCRCPRHNLCDGFNTLLLKSILHPILLERFIGAYKLWWLSWRNVSSGHCLLQQLFSFLTAFFNTFDDIGIGRELFLPESTFTYTVVKCKAFHRWGLMWS